MTLVFMREATTTGDLLLTDYDFYIDTENETFRLPLLNGSENKLGKFESIPLPAFGSDFSNPYVNGMYEVFASRSTDDGYLYIANKTTDFEADNNTPTDGWGRVFCPASLGDTIFIGTSIPEGGQRFARYAKYIGNGSLYFYVGETVQNANLIDAGRIGEILPTKTDMQQAAKASMPSDRYIDLTLGASGSTYTAPANGYFQLNKQTTGNNQFIYFQDDSISMLYTLASISYTGGLWCHCQVAKGRKIKVYYSAAGKTDLFRFIYAEGEV